MLARHRRRQVDVDGGERLARGREVEVVGRGLAQDVLDLALVDEALGDRGIPLFEADSERGGGRALDVEIDQQHLVAAPGQPGGEVHRGGGLADAALLVRDANGGHAPTLSPLDRARKF